MELSAGEIVRSKAGRDQGQYFVVLEVLDGNYVTICDGKRRKAEKPKRKKKKHLCQTGETAAAIAEKLAVGQAVTNPELRRAVGRMNRDNL